ncbi:DUF4827 domain-containing protein [Xylanibacter caecicola]|uniref:DUF4827 domain-containing protein n=1 Tax=Xylanibacter caecicola TaxID=2736294 RepID=UPI00258A901B|nr:DUF4827 domain-containing protein [Xylanibacter caecicola]
MNKITYVFMAFFAMILAVACDDTETYAEQKDRERAAIQEYIRDSSVTVISEEQFFAQDTTTNLERNEYVLLNRSGVYMQIIRKGCGERIKPGETTTVLCRFKEWNLLTDSLQCTNEVMSFAHMVDKMNVTNTSGSFSASFLSGQSVMASFYNSTSVPSGWLAPLSYIKVGRQSSPDEEIAKVKIIVPHTQGHQYASSGVYPCLYELTYERGR